MKKAALFVSLFFSVACIAQTPFSSVNTAIHHGRYATAFSILDSCNSKNYYSDSVLFYRGLTFLKKGDIKAAKKNCHLLLKTYPAFYEGHYLNGLIQYSDENFGKSIDEFNLALKGNPKHTKALFNRALVFGILEDYLAAIEDLTACIELDPNYALAYYSRGYWYEFTGNYAEAAKDYENVVRLDPRNFDAYYGLAYVYQNQKETGKACEAITRAILEGSQIAEELKSNFCR